MPDDDIGDRVRQLRDEIGRAIANKNASISEFKELLVDLESLIIDLDLARQHYRRTARIAASRTKQ